MPQRAVASVPVTRVVATGVRAMSLSRGTERPRSNVVRSGDGQSILYESITQVPTDLRCSRNFGLIDSSVVRVGLPARVA